MEPTMQMFHHPEQGKQEVYLGNYTEEAYHVLVYKTKRMGTRVFSDWPPYREVSHATKLRPVFVSVVEYDEREKVRVRMSKRAYRRTRQ